MEIRLRLLPFPHWEACPFPGTPNDPSAIAIALGQRIREGMIFWLRFIG